VRVLLLAGEPSGDRYAAGIARAVADLRPDAEVRAMGGGALRQAGVELVVDSTELAVMGLTEVLSHLPQLLRARRELRACLDEWKPDVVVPVDYPEFNLRIAGDARKRGIPVAWFISPQVWAWRPGRVPGIGERISKMLVIFDFETALYEKHGIPVEHVGHPLMDFLAPPPSAEAARKELGLPLGGEVVALLPGSRLSELRRTWPVLAAAARRLAGQRPGLSFVVPLAPGLDERHLREIDAAEGLALSLRPEALVPALAAADASAIASGTATLEAGLLGHPFLVGYRVSGLTMALSRFLAEPDFLARGLVALPNLVLGEQVVPELLQESFTPEAVAEELGSLLGDPARRARMEARLAELPERLGGAGTLERVARAALEVAAGRGS
jgi:lipid-A-disaccharide synthase